MITEKELLTVRCPRCVYEWNTASQHFYVSCPRCRHTLKIRRRGE